MTPVPGVDMASVVGVTLGLVVCVFARLVGFDRDRAFYPTMLTAIASYYVLFAVMGGSAFALIVESIAMTAFLLAAVMGFKLTPGLVVAALGVHGVFDAFHREIVTNPGVPEWWPPFCLTFDVTAAGFLAWLSIRSAQKNVC
jgi:hypothetical protein